MHRLYFLSLYMIRCKDRQSVSVLKTLKLQRQGIIQFQRKDQCLLNIMNILYGEN